MGDAGSIPDVTPVLDHVVQDGHYLNLVVLDAHHPPQDVRDVGRPILVLLLRMAWAAICNALLMVAINPPFACLTRLAGWAGPISE